MVWVWNAGVTFEPSSASDAARQKTDAPAPTVTPAIKNQKPIKIANCFWPKNGLLAQFASSLDDAIRDTAEDAGVLDNYINTVDEYRKAMKLNDLWEATQQQGVRILKYATPGAAAYAIKSAVSR